MDLHLFSLSSPRYLVLIAYSSCSPHRAVSFRRILVRTPGWFDRYSPLTSIFGSLLETRELPGEKFSRSLRRVQIENQGELAGEQRRRYPFFSRGSRVEKNPV
ncbi:hypothetical protein CK203_055372 [Vitis vinifera]|uniref:Uncharacterized protein n=1 Tax=Vitis vinifera TaxID=29760 RepID=A0A438GSY7_VITVI|nr:hypothetical protein CK203_055372 [Vitis vinifera]